MTTWDFAPTHVVPQAGMPAWEGPDVSRPTEPLDPLLPVQLLERRGDWARILCVNGWSAWVDGRLLVSVPQEPPAAAQPMARTADPRPLLARVEDSLGRYRRAAEDLAGGHADGEGFRRRTQGLRVGMVVDGESVWLYDAEHERWVYCDGVRLSTLAAAAAPVATAAPDPPAAQPDPTRDVPPEPVRDDDKAGPGQEQPGPARPAGPEAAPGDRPGQDPEATRTVGAEPGPGVGAGRNPDAEETQLVEPAPTDPGGDRDTDRPDTTRLVDGTGHPPTRRGDR